MAGPLETQPYTCCGLTLFAEVGMIMQAAALSPKIPRAAPGSAVYHWFMPHHSRQKM